MSEVPLQRREVTRTRWEQLRCYLRGGVGGRAVAGGGREAVACKTSLVTSTPLASPPPLPEGARTAVGMVPRKALRHRPLHYPYPDSYPDSYPESNPA